MTIAELRRRLEDAHVPPETYSLTGGLPDRALCIEQLGDKWRVYYSERGLRSDVRAFETEADATHYFWETFMRPL